MTEEAYGGMSAAAPVHTYVCMYIHELIGTYMQTLSQETQKPAILLKASMKVIFVT